MSAAARPEVRFLRRGQLLRVDPRGPVEIGCLAGRLWITQASRADDVWLLPGEAAVMQGRGLVLVEADAASRVRLSAQGQLIAG